MDIFERYGAQRADLAGTSQRSDRSILDLAHEVRFHPPTYIVAAIRTMGVKGMADQLGSEWTAEKLVFAADRLDPVAGMMEAKRGEWLKEDREAAEREQFAESCKRVGFIAKQARERQEREAEKLALLRKLAEEREAQHLPRATAPETVSVEPKASEPTHKTGGGRTRHQATTTISNAVKKLILRLRQGELKPDLVSRTCLAEFLLDRLPGEGVGVDDLTVETLRDAYLTRGRPGSQGLEPEGVLTRKKGAKDEQKAKEELARAWREGQRRESTHSIARPLQRVV